MCTLANVDFRFGGKAWLVFFLFGETLLWKLYGFLFAKPVFQHMTLVYFPFVSFDESIIAEVAHTLQNASTSKQTYIHRHIHVNRESLLTAVPLCR